MCKINQAKWIWGTNDFDSPNQYMIFKKSFVANKNEIAKISISCDSDFKIFLNGKIIGKDQFPDYPQEKTYSVFDIKNFIDGENIITIEAYYAGCNTSTYTKGKAGLIAAIEFENRTIFTDKSWFAAQNFAFQNGEIELVSSQLAFVVAFNANKIENLIYKNAIERENSTGDYIKSLSLRPLPPLVEGEKIFAKLVYECKIYRYKNDGTFADMVHEDIVCNDNKKANGLFFVGDLGRETVGEFFIKVKASAGTIIDISHGEYLLNNMVSNKIQNRNFTDRYICKEGENSYRLPFRRLGARFLQLNVTNTNNFKLLEFGLYETNQDLPPKSMFKTNEIYSNKIYEVATHTLKCCMHNHYEDCPWREQSLYAYDSRVQMLFNYYSFGNYSFTRESLDLLGRGLNKDNGYLNMCAPTKYRITIPCFSMVWVCAMYEYYLYSGDKTLLEKYSNQFDFMANKYLENKSYNANLYCIKDDKTLWNFYEWVNGLDSTKELAAKEPIKNTNINLLFNVYLYEMLKALVKIYQELNNTLCDKYQTISDILGENIEKTFYNDDKKCYATKIIDGNFDELYHEHSQFVMLKNNLVPKEKISNILNAIDDKKIIPLTFSPLFYNIEAVFDTTPEQREKFVKNINQKYLKMIEEGATTFYETQDGYKAFDNAGSLCHAWSSIHSYYYGAKVLGIKPLKVAFKEFELKIYANEFDFAEGEVPTPSGKIFVKWKKIDNKLNIKIRYPKNLKLNIKTYIECPINEVIEEKY